MRKTIEQILEIIENYGTLIKYSLIILLPILIILDARTYINYMTIQDSISAVKENVKLLDEEIAYNEKFLDPYLDSDYAVYFLSHKNNILFDWEYIIKFEEETPEEETEKTKKNEIITNANDSRQLFLGDKLQKI